MSVFSSIAELVSGGASKVGQAIGGLRSALASLASLADGNIRRQAAFTIAIIALSAKMAKADGVVTRPEVDAFCRTFAVPPGEEVHVSRVYNLAKRDIAGYEAYARDIARLLADDRAMLEDILDGLFEIAKADGAVHEREMRFLERIAELFGLDSHAFAQVRARHVAGDSDDPFVALGADPSWSFETLRGHYRRLVSENHPDRLIARGVPEPFIRIATDRLAAINGAWERIEAMRAHA